MKQLVRYILRFAPIAAIVLSIFELVLSNQFVGSGKEIRTVDISIDTVRAQNALLEQQVASASSLLTIHTKASELGFIEAQTSHYITLSTSQLPVAFNASN